MCPCVPTKWFSFCQGLVSVKELFGEGWYDVFTTIIE
eukprot:symbB.v1.2.042750.t1/scaffold10894.1/size1453/1